MKLRVKLQGEICTVYTDPEKRIFKNGQFSPIAPVSIEDFHTPPAGCVPFLFRKDQLPLSFPGYEIEFVRDPNEKDPPVSKSSVTEAEVNAVFKPVPLPKRPDVAQRDQLFELEACLSNVMGCDHPALLRWEFRPELGFEYQRCRDCGKVVTVNRVF